MNRPRFLLALGKLREYAHNAQSGGLTRLADELQAAAAPIGEAAGKVEVKKSRPKRRKVP